MLFGSLLSLGSRAAFSTSRHSELFVAWTHLLCGSPFLLPSALGYCVYHVRKMWKGPNVRCSEVATLSSLQRRARWRKIPLQVLNFLLVKRVGREEEDVDLGPHERLYDSCGSAEDATCQAVGQRKVVLLDIRRGRPGVEEELKWDLVDMFCSWKLPTETCVQWSPMLSPWPTEDLVILSWTWMLFSYIPSCFLWCPSISLPLSLSPTLF